MCVCVCIGGEVGGSWQGYPGVSTSKSYPTPENLTENVDMGGVLDT